jgi:hypothetical protein
LVDGVDLLGANVDAMPGLREAATEQATHGAGAEHGDIHGDEPSERCARGSWRSVRQVNI